MGTDNYNRMFIMLLVTGLFFSCVKTDDFSLPELEIPEITPAGNIITIAAVKSQFNFQTRDILIFGDADTFMEGYVISSDEGGNFYKKLILQDRPENPTAGIQVLIDDTSLFTTYNIGRKVYVKLAGLSLGYQNGVLQLGKQNRSSVVIIPGPLIDEHIIRTTQTVEITALPLEISNFSENHKNIYVRLENVQFNRNIVREDARFTFAGEAIDRFDGERQLESCRNSAVTILSTSTFSNFKSLLLPTNSGNLEGVLTRNFTDDFFVVILNTPETIFFGNTGRCDPEFLTCGGNNIPGNEIVFQESFETITTQRMLDSRGWTNVNVSGGSKRFETGATAGNRAVRISAFNTQENPMEVWLVTPGINLDRSSGEVLSFDIKASFDDFTILDVFVTTGFTGNPVTTSWRLLDARVPVGPSGQVGASFKRSNIDVSCLQGTLHVGFRYLGGVPDKTTAYDIDNIRLTGN